jgi:hypothetical protein
MLLIRVRIFYCSCFAANAELLHTFRSNFLPSALAFFYSEKKWGEPGKIFYLNLRVMIAFTPFLPISWFLPPRALPKWHMMCFCL